MDRRRAGPRTRPSNGRAHGHWLSYVHGITAVAAAAAAAPAALHACCGDAGAPAAAAAAATATAALPEWRAAAGAAATLHACCARKLTHEVCQLLRALQRHAVVDGGAHAAHAAVTLELDLKGGWRAERVEGGEGGSLSERAARALRRLRGGASETALQGWRAARPGAQASAGGPTRPARTMLRLAACPMNSFSRSALEGMVKGTFIRERTAARGQGGGGGGGRQGGRAM